MDDAMYQKLIKMGTDVNRAKKIVVFSPPPTFHAPYAGTIMRRPKRAVLEKLVAPAPSAGRGAFLIAGYCR